jgi:hypothetical protein
MVRCHVSCAMCHVPCAMCHVPCAMCHPRQRHHAGRRLKLSLTPVQSDVAVAADSCGTTRAPIHATRASPSAATSVTPADRADDFHPACDARTPGCSPADWNVWDNNARSSRPRRSPRAVSRKQNQALRERYGASLRARRSSAIRVPHSALRHAFSTR